MCPALTISMRYATKKECAGLLALLGEESLMACRKRGETERSIGVSWVGNYIVTVETYYEGLLLRVTAPLYVQDLDELEKRFQEAAMRDQGRFCFSVREMSDFVLAEITAYSVSRSEKLDIELNQMLKKLCYVLLSA